MSGYRKYFRPSNFKLFYELLQKSNIIKHIIYNKRVIIISLTGLVTCRKFPLQYFSTNVIYAKEPNKSEDKEEQVRVTSHREQRFKDFASIEYNNNAFMTPRDFLESIIYDSPKTSRVHKRHLNQQEVKNFVKNTPSRRQSSKKMFNEINNEGLISFTEYLFLLCFLTKPRSGFKIAFSMFDVDGDKYVDRKGFLIIQKSLFGSTNGTSLLACDRRHPVPEEKNIWRHPVPEEKNIWRHPVPEKRNIWGHPVPEKRNIWQIANEEANIFGEDGEHVVTTLLIHFFGPRGNDVLNYQDFSKFMENLQTEVLELEFAEFSHGFATISEIDFAHILLRYTQLTEDEKAAYMTRLNERVRQFQGIKFEDFRDFCQFLNNIDDFSLAMRIYTYADHPINEMDFNRAVKACTGQNLNPHVVHVVFQLFDTDGDGQLSYKEFISVMKARLHRGAKSVHSGAWDSFKHCYSKK